MICTYLAAIVMGARAASLRSSSSLNADACPCLNWKKTYANKMVECGQTNEYFLYTHKHDSSAMDRLEMDSSLGPTFCDGFYKAIDDNSCVNFDIGADKGTWCYVSGECADATLVPGKALRWKNCSAHDHRLRDLTPTTLAAFVADNDLDLALVHKMSYPVHKDIMWRDVEAFWGLGGPKARRLPAQLRQEMQEIADAGTPYSFDTRIDKQPPHRIVMGKSVYAVNSLARDFQHPKTWNELVCLTGCDQ